MLHKSSRDGDTSATSILASTIANTPRLDIIGIDPTKDYGFRYWSWREQEWRFVVMIMMLDCGAIGRGGVASGIGKGINIGGGRGGDARPACKGSNP